MKSIGIIGYGNMGEALVEGLKKKNPDTQVYVIEKSEQRRATALQRIHAIDCGSDYKKILAETDIVILAVKPQDVAHVLEALHPHSTGRRIISIIAGKRIDYFKSSLKAVEIARFMPNLAARMGKSVTGISYSNECTDQFRMAAREVADSIGSSIEIPEHLMPGIVGISGSGIAFVFEFIQSLAMAGVREGLPYSSALEAALDVVMGAVDTIKSEKIHPEEMISRVCSPAGTTIEGMHALAQGGFSVALMEAVRSAANRARELEG